MLAAVQLAGLAGSRNGMSEPGSLAASPLHSPNESRPYTQQHRRCATGVEAGRGASLSFGSPALQSIHVLDVPVNQEDNSFRQLLKSSCQEPAAGARLSWLVPLSRRLLLRPALVSRTPYVM
jgi:hypothetical protein